jgi:large subunit ribosomal protein L16
MLQPKRTQFRKFQKGRVDGVKSNTTGLQFGSYGIKAMESGRLPARTVEAVRRVLTRKFKRTGQIWIRVFPDLAVSAKPGESRMGKGKGAPAFWVCRIQRGQILFEMDGVAPQLAHQAAMLAYYKLPLKTKYVARSGV